MNAVINIKNNNCIGSILDIVHFIEIFRKIEFIIQL